MVAALALTSFLAGFHLGSIFAVAQTIAGSSMRALASAIVLLTATCFGQGVGPLAVGMLNDALKVDFGAETVRYSLLSAAVTTTLGALLFVWAARSIAAISSRRADPTCSPPALPFVFVAVSNPVRLRCEPGRIRHAGCT
jgi:MFS family permease